MATGEISKALIESLKNSEVLKAIEDQIVAPAVRRAVTEVAERYEAKIRELSNIIADQDIKLNVLEQYSRKNNLIISGVREHQGESTPGLVIELGRILGVTLRPDDIDAAHRLGRQQNGRPRQILARFVTLTKRDELYRERKSLRGIELPRDSTLTRDMVCDAYITDNLTRYNSELMYAARELKRAGRLDAAWTDAGKPKVRVAQSGPTKMIQSAADLRKLVGDHTAIDAADQALRHSQPVIPVDDPESAPLTSTSGAASAASGRGAAASRSPARVARDQPSGGASRILNASPGNAPATPGTPAAASGRRNRPTRSRGR